MIKYRLNCKVIYIAKCVIGLSRMETRIKILLFFGIIILGILFIATYFKVQLKSQSIPVSFFLVQKYADEDQHISQKVVENFKKIPHEMKMKTDDRSSKLLITTFKKADENGDGILEIAELVSWVAKRIREHLTEALKENIFIFTSIDKNPQNGVVSWEEYFHYFMKSRGHTKTSAEEHIVSLKGLSRDTKESIMREKAAWSQAVRDDPSRLSLDEFLAFRHPESSHATIISMVEETLARLDVDDDGALSESEFSDPELNKIHENVIESKFVEERLKEFRNTVDENKNGFAERKELINYYNPRNIHHAEKEAMDLISLADLNGDWKLTLPEVMMHKDQFLQSKMVDVAISFHDEF